MDFIVVVKDSDTDTDFSPLRNRRAMPGLKITRHSHLTINDRLRKIRTSRRKKFSKEYRLILIGNTYCADDR